MANYKFFQNKECEYFPCHKDVDIKEFNCLFCYCPLYCLKEECGGNYTILPSGVKDCSKCKKPHLGEEGYEYIRKRIKNVVELVKKVD
jgi:Zn-finger protein